MATPAGRQTLQEGRMMSKRRHWANSSKETAQVSAEVLGAVGNMGRNPFQPEKLMNLL